MSDMDLKTRVENLPCGTCEDMMNCDDCYHQKEAKDLYKQIRAEVYDECKYNAELFREIFLEDLIQQSVDREEAMMYRNICEMAWNKYLEHLKEKQNANRNRCDL